MSQRKSNNWAALLSEAMATRANHPNGEGWKTFEEIRVEWGLGHSKARTILDRLQSAGRLEVFEGTGQNNNGRLVRRVWYRPL